MTETDVTSFAKALVLGEIHEELVFPYPLPGDEEAEKVRGLISRFRDYAAENIDARRDRRGGVDRRPGLPRPGRARAHGPLRRRRSTAGQGLSQTGYARVFEASGRATARSPSAWACTSRSASRASRMYGTDEQKERFLPDLAAGRKLAGFALTEPNAGSDAYNIESRAVLQPDGSWVLNGEKRWIGNGGRGDVFTTFARAEVDGKDSHIALILEKGMEGFESGERYETMGLRGNNLTPAVLQRRSRAARERARRARRGLPDRDADPQQRAHRARHGRRRPGQAPDRPGDRARHDAPPVRPAARRLRHGRGQDRLDGRPTCSAWSRWPT